MTVHTKVTVQPHSAVKQSGSAISIRGLTKTFGDNRVLQSTELEIPAGQILVLLGPSGCGKTTLLRLIAGLERPDGPDMIRFDGEDVSGLPIEKRNVGMVFQSYALFPNMNVGENIAYGMKIRGMERTQREAETKRLLALVGLTEYADRRITAISGGQRQRTALARALAIKPRVLLLDEPLAALDAVLREHLRVEIGNLLREFGITAVYVTHDQGEAMAIGDRIAVMEKGRIAQIDIPQEIYHRPSSNFVADFVGTMNRLPGRVENGVLTLGENETVVRVPANGPDRLTTLCFRPEAVRLVESGGQVKAKVVSTTFFGATQRLIADIANECRLQLDLPSSLRFTPGQIISFDIQPTALLELRN